MNTLHDIRTLHYTNKSYMYVYTHVFLKSQPDFVMILFLLGRGVFSISKSIGFDPVFLQLPLTGALQNELMTRNA